MLRFARALQVFALALLLTSCGGGGGGGGGSDSTSAALSFSPATLSANIAVNSSATLTVRATATDPGMFNAGVYVLIVDNAGLLLPSIELAMVDTTTFSVTLHTSPTMAVGRYQGSFPVHLCVDSQCTREYAGSPVNLPYDLTVSEAPLQAIPNASTTVAVPFGTTADPIQIAVSGPALAWTATTSTGWLSINGGSGTGAGTFTVNRLTSALSSGTHAGSVTVRASDGQTVDIPFSVSVQPFVPALSAPSTTLTFGGVDGHDLSTPQSIVVSLNTGATAWPYTVSGLPSWLSVTPASGSVSQVGATLSFVPVSANVTPGSTTATVSIEANVDGEVVTLPVTVNLNADQHQLLASEWGIGMASTPIGNTLAHTVSISDNFGGTLNWTSSVDVPWLTVTSAGDTTNANDLVIVADPTAMPADVISYANVTVSTSVAGVEPAVIRVALWKSATGITAVTTLPQQYTNVVADMIRPYAYAHNGGTDIDVYNVHTAQKIATITGVGSTLGQMSVGPDGQRLFVLDTAARNLAIINLATQTKEADWALVNAVSQSTPVLAIRPNGTDVVLLGDRTAYARGNSLGSGFVYGAFLAATRDGRQVFGGDGSIRFDTDYSAMSGGTLFMTLAGNVDIASRGNPQDFAVSSTGTRAYSASGGGLNSNVYKCAAIDAVAGTLIGALPGGEAYPNNVEVAVDGRAICGISGTYAPYDIWVHSPTGTLLQGYKFAGYAKSLLSRQLVVSPDGLVAVGLTSDPRIAFVPIGAP